MLEYKVKLLFVANLDIVSCQTNILVSCSKRIHVFVELNAERERLNV